MDDTISRQAAIEALDALCDRECEYSKQQRSFMCGACRLGSAFDVIDELPSAERRGRWIYNANFAEPPFKCSACGKSQGRLSNYCPDCGARMEEDA